MHPTSARAHNVRPSATLPANPRVSASRVNIRPKPPTLHYNGGNLSERGAVYIPKRHISINKWAEDLKSSVVGEELSTEELLKRYVKHERLSLAYEVIQHVDSEYHAKRARKYKIQLERLDDKSINQRIASQREALMRLRSKNLLDHTEASTLAEVFQEAYADAFENGTMGLCKTFNLLEASKRV